MFGRVYSGFARARTRRQLQALSDQQLSDIGLSRDQIDDVARRLSERHAREAHRAEPLRSNLSLALQSD
jgi:hypothetical protein